MSIPNRIARLSSTGATDASFDPGAGLNGEGLCVAVLPVVVAGETPGELTVERKIVVGGDFTAVNGAGRERLAVLNADGSLVETEVAVNAPVRMLLPQTDGRVILGGDFTTINAEERGHLARLRDNFALEETFNPMADAAVHAAALQKDGKVIAGGAHTEMGATPVTRQALARLYNDDAAVSKLAVKNAGKVEWQRGVTSEEAERVTFELSTDGGATWAALGGKISRTGQGWQAADHADFSLTLSGEGDIRARACMGTGRSEGLHEEIHHFDFVPSLLVEQPSGAPRTHDDTVHPLDFGNVQIGKTLEAVFSLRNEGLADLAVTGVTFGGTHAGQFSVTGTFPATLENQEAMTFSVRFAPTSTEGKTAYLLIASDDPGVASFKVYLQGGGVAGPGAPELTYLAPAMTAGSYPVSALAYGYDSPALMIGGSFTKLGTKARYRMSRLDENGNLLVLKGTGITTANSDVFCAAALPNKKFMLGGSFAKGLVRLNADDTVDGSFKVVVASRVNTKIPAVVRAMVVQADGKIIIGGSFSHLSVGNSHFPHSNVARLNADGTIDGGWNPACGSVEEQVRTLALQADGKLLVGGVFSTAASGTRKGVARLNPDGTLDATFDADLANGSQKPDVSALAVQRDGKILIGGQFDHIGLTEVAWGISRVHADGSIDMPFTTVSANQVYSMVLQCDGKLLVATSDTEKLRRVHASGALDTEFVPVARGGVHSLALDGKGSVMVGGNFSLSSRPYTLAKLKNGPAASCVMAVAGAAEVKWTRSDTAPETQQVTFELSQNGGVSWTPLGAATRQAEGGAWSLTGLNLPISGMVRGLARTPGGFYNGSNGVHEQILTYASQPAPDISVTPTATRIGGVTKNLINAPAITNLGAVRLNGELPGRSSSMTLTIRNPGRANLSGITATVTQNKPAVKNGVPVEWTIDAQSGTTVAQNADGSLRHEVTLGITFTPGAALGEHEATLVIKSNVPGVNGHYAILLQSRTLALPLVITNTATAVGSTHATLVATVRPNHDKANVYFMYKTHLAATYTKVSMADLIVSGTVNQTVQHVLTGLTPGTRYHAYAVISNSVNPPEAPITTNGTASDFTTPAF